LTKAQKKFARLESRVYAVDGPGAQPANASNPDRAKMLPLYLRGLRELASGMFATKRCVRSVRANDTSTFSRSISMCR